MTPTRSKSHTKAEKVVQDKANFIQDVSQQFNQEEMSDIKLVVGSKFYYAHKFVLAKSSDVMRSMFYKRKWLESEKSEIHLEETPEACEVFERFLRYLYTGEVSLNNEVVLPLLCLSDKYNVASLVALCSNYMLEHCKSPNYQAAMKWLPWAKMLNVAPLLEGCQQTISWNFYNIIHNSQFAETSSVDFLEAFLERSSLVVPDEFSLWRAVNDFLLVEKNVDELPSNAARLLPLIRFSQMSLGELLLVEGCELVNKEDSPCGKLLLRLILRAYKFHSMQPDGTRSKPKLDFGDTFYKPRYYLNRIVCKFGVSEHSPQEGRKIDAQGQNSAAHNEKIVNLLIFYRRVAESKKLEWNVQSFCREWCDNKEDKSSVEVVFIYYNNRNKILKVSTKEMSKCKAGELHSTIEPPEGAMQAALMFNVIAK